MCTYIHICIYNIYNIYTHIHSVNICIFVLLFKRSTHTALNINTDSSIYTSDQTYHTTSDKNAVDVLSFRRCKNTERFGVLIGCRLISCEFYTWMAAPCTTVKTRDCTRPEVSPLVCVLGTRVGRTSPVHRGQSHHQPPFVLTNQD